MAASLSSMKCEACEAGAPTVTAAEEVEFLPQIPEWTIVEEGGKRRLRRTFAFKDFAGALAFANRVGARAEEVDHHPALLVEWGRVTVDWWTHVLPDFHKNDFIMAARTDEAYSAAS